MSTARLARSAAALALAVAGLAVPVTAASVLTAGPAAAATCGGGPGVTVVVDASNLDGGVSTGCDGNGGGYADDNFREAGVVLEMAQGAGGPGGFVCRVEGDPGIDAENCQGASPASDYWHLWWSDGKSGKWQSSGLGVTSLQVPAGGSVAFRFSEGDSGVSPDVSPPVYRAESPAGSGSSSGSSSSGSGGSSAGGAAPSNPAPSATAPTPSASPATPATPTPTASGAPDAQDDRGDRRRAAPGDGLDRDRAEQKARPDEDRKGARDRRDAAVTPSTEPETEQETTLVDDPVDPQAAEAAAADGLPVWVAPVLVVGLLLVGGAVAGVRRFRGAPGRP